MMKNLIIKKSKNVKRDIENSESSPCEKTTFLGHFKSEFFNVQRLIKNVITTKTFLAFMKVAITRKNSNFNSS